MRNPFTEFLHAAPEMDDYHDSPRPRSFSFRPVLFIFYVQDILFAEKVAGTSRR